MTQALVATRAQLHAWAGTSRRVRSGGGGAAARRSALLLVLGGCLGALAGGDLIGRWCMGLVLIAESAGAIWLGLNQEDGGELPLLGARTVDQVLDDERLRE